MIDMRILFRLALFAIGVLGVLALADAEGRFTALQKEMRALKKQ
jgi:hypothetical protein